MFSECQHVFSAVRLVPRSGTMSRSVVCHYKVWRGCLLQITLEDHWRNKCNGMSAAGEGSSCRMLSAVVCEFMDGWIAGYSFIWMDLDKEDSGC